MNVMQSSISENLDNSRTEPPTAPAATFDKEFALLRVGGDVELLKELAQLFVEDYPNGLASLQTAIAEQDAGGLERHAHNIKGAASNFGAEDVLKAAGALEAKGRACQIDGAELELVNLENALTRLRSELVALGED